MSLLAVLIVGLALVVLAYFLPTRQPWTQILYTIGAILVVVAGVFLIASAIDANTVAAPLLK
jgi:hypothetical protein